MAWVASPLDVVLGDWVGGTRAHDQKIEGMEEELSRKVYLPTTGCGGNM